MGWVDETELIYVGQSSANQDVSREMMPTQGADKK